ncbi:MAG: bifunctional 23S rRNA (guanine(2069)-N(7))-methyltransferase RlmK/23S rRNA (guanine(2445)-N(2))-methyltransferase RlmL [Nannocystaceae bacterium]|nr:bifunctional 23S rRNA (guanine(2069)-N(7))-methyltransferase RlmK/23S rRNA (guanine(2445)-N(2))-methyltransferase RlmL [Nannocystaceae bacterium]
MSTAHSFFVTAARGLVPLLADELVALGARVVRPAPGGVRVRGPLSFGYRICLWSRTASRVILHLADFPIDGTDALYAGVHALAWEDHVAPTGTIAVDVVASGEVITHSQFAARRVKDAVVDRLRARFGERPSVDLQQPDVRISVYVRGRGCSVGIDLAGESLHRRHWRGDHGPAPLKETLAAGLLLRAGWPARVAQGQPLLDPLCGAGTLPIEAASMAADRAPALLRARFGFSRWLGHDAEAWTALAAEARERAEAARAHTLPPIVGFDVDARVLAHARENAARAGVAALIRFERREVARAEPGALPPGLLVGNPPYGERLGTAAQVATLFRELATTMHERFAGWHAELIVAEAAPLPLLGLAIDEQQVDNGPIACRFVAGTLGQPIAAPEPSDAPHDDADADDPALEADRSAFEARLRRNRERLRPWLDRYDVRCYRLYDDELPGFRAIVDVYGDRVHLQEYQAPRSIDPARAQARLVAMAEAVAAALQLPREAIVLKQRRSQAAAGQYGRLDARGEELAVREGRWTFLVNLHDRLDTGLFLDHRALRRMVAEHTRRGQRMLNLFGYTGTISVAAASAGARTTTVDLSQTYLEWARRNFAANGLDVREHGFVRADVLQWLGEHRGQYDRVVCDPPSYSASKAMRQTLEIQRDHVALVHACQRLVAPGGELLFSTNKRGFVLDPSLTDLVDITRHSLDPDVRRDPPPHRAWRWTRPAAADRSGR